MTMGSLGASSPTGTGATISTISQLISFSASVKRNVSIKVNKTTSVMGERSEGGRAAEGWIRTHFQLGKFESAIDDGGQIYVGEYYLG